MFSAKRTSFFSLRKVLGRTPAIYSFNLCAWNCMTFCYKYHGNDKMKKCFHSKCGFHVLCCVIALWLMFKKTWDEMKFSTFNFPRQNVKRLRSISSENIFQIVVLFRVRKPQPQNLLNLCCTKKIEVYEI